MNVDYRIAPIAADEEREADGVHVNAYGAWLGEFTTNIADDGSADDKVMPFCDEDNDYIPAPEDWRTRIIARPITPQDVRAPDGALRSSRRTTVERTENMIQALQRAEVSLEAIADQLEDDQRFSDAHRLNAAISYIAAVAHTLQQEKDSATRPTVFERGDWSALDEGAGDDAGTRTAG